MAVLSEQKYTVTFASGASVASVSHGLRGTVHKIYVDYSTGTYASVDVIVYDDHNNVIWRKDDNVTDIVAYPVIAPSDNTGTTLTNGTYSWPKPIVHGDVKVKLDSPTTHGGTNYVYIYTTKE